MALREQIPNTITGSRIVLVYVCLFALDHYFYQNDMNVFWWGLAIAISYMLDGVDGRLAHRYGWTSEFGAMFDPAGDKVVAISSLLFLYKWDMFFLWALIVVIIRDIILSSLRLLSKKYKLSFETSQMGRLRTCIVGFGAGVLLFWHYFGTTYPWVRYSLHIALGVLALVTTLLFIKVIKNDDRGLLGRFRTREEKWWGWSTIVLCAIYPSISIPISMVIITIFTMWDYGREFVAGARASEVPDHLKKVGKEIVWHMILTLILMTAVIVIVTYTLLWAIVLSSVIFLILLALNVRMIPKKEKRREEKTTITKVSQTVRQTLV